MKKPLKHAETITIHGGNYRFDEATHSIIPPIYQSVSYQFESVEHAADLFSLKESGNIYTRMMNPTVEILENRMAELEGGLGALALSSGQAATSYCLLNLCKAGDNIIASTDLYGGTANLFKNTVKNFGIEVRFADPSEPKNFEKLTDNNTKAYFGETCANPSLKVFPIEEVAEIGKKFSIPLIIDNTMAPIICKPLKAGASIVLYSLTKFIGGQGNSIGGLIIDGGTFDWSQDKKRHPYFNEKDPSYDGVIWSDFALNSLKRNIPFLLRARLILLRDLGSALSSFNAWLILQGLETLALRMKQHCVNAEKVATYLKHHPKVDNVIYPLYHKGESLKFAKKYLQGGFGGLCGVELKGGLDAGKKFIEALTLFYHVANIGDTRSLAIHPASTTHYQMLPNEQLKAGVTPGYVRLSIGIENPDDILEDLEQALNQI